MKSKILHYITGSNDQQPPLQHNNRGGHHRGGRGGRGGPRGDRAHMHDRYDDERVRHLGQVKDFLHKVTLGTNLV